MQPARSYSPFRYIPGICAVSPPSKGTPRGAARAGKSAKQLLEHVRFEFLAADVIEEEKRTRAEHCDVVDAMVHQIGADGVVLVHREGDLQFRADAVDARDQNRIAHSGKRRAKQSAEPADFAEHLRAMRSPNE